MYTDLEHTFIWLSVATAILFNISVEVDNLPLRFVSALAYVGCFICMMLLGFTLTAAAITLMGGMLAAADATAKYDERVRKGELP